MRPNFLLVICRPFCSVRSPEGSVTIPAYVNEAAGHSVNSPSTHTLTKSLLLDSEIEAAITECSSAHKRLSEGVSWSQSHDRRLSGHHAVAVDPEALEQAQSLSPDLMVNTTCLS